MAGDTEGSRRKHRRSASEDESEKYSKRHKHRHHHRRHRHGHGSKKHEEESNRDCEDIAVPSVPIPPVLNSSRLEDDLEEGEILEDDGLGVGEDVFVERKAKEVGIGDESHKSKMGLLAGNESSYQEDSMHMEERIGYTLHKEANLYRQNYVGLQSNDEFGSYRNLSNEVREKLVSNASLEGCVNGDLDRESHKRDKRQHKESSLLSKEAYKRSDFFDNEKVDVDGSKSSKRKKSSSEITGDENGSLVRSPSYDRYHDSNRSRSKSRSNDHHAWERSRSHQIGEEEALSKSSGHRDWDASMLADKSRTCYDSVDEKHHVSTDLMRGDNREHDMSYSRYSGGEDRHRSRDTKDRGRSRDREWGREKERERSRDRRIEGVRERSSERRREMELDWSEREVERDRRKEKERDRSGDKDRDRDRKREKERDWTREKARATETDRDRERSREKQRVRDRERTRDRVNEKGDDRSRDYFATNREKYRGGEDGYGNKYRHKDYRRPREDENVHNRDKRRKSDQEKLHTLNSNQGGVEDILKRDDEVEVDDEETVAFQPADQEEEDLNRIKEESRRRRQAILEKYKSEPLEKNLGPHADEVAKDKEPADNHGESVSAANTAPEIADAVDDYAADPSFAVGKTPPQNGITVSERTPGAGGLGYGTSKSERSDEIFCDDIFGETPARVRKTGKGDGLQIEKSGLRDNWDDADGYYSYRFGEVLDGRYEVTAAHGKGVFSTVVRARNLKAGNGEPEEVAIKILRSNETMYKAGLGELVILKKLVGADPDDKRHCVRFLSSFKYRNHLCLVFESLHMNLREVLKKFGRNIGLKLTAVRAYAKQLFIALKHLRNCGVLHCDIKPDNMLVNEAKNVLKLCDFGNAMFAGKNEVTPYLVSRFYRAPEIILGLTYDHPVDIWSVGCCLYELYTGKVLFPGPSNNDMLRLHMELKGPYPKKMLRKGAFTDQHFDQDLNFHATEEDPVTKKAVKRMIVNIKPKDIGSVITGYSGEDPKMLSNFKDLLDKIFALDPDKRMTVSQALNHPFITGK